MPSWRAASGAFLLALAGAACTRQIAPPVPAPMDAVVGDAAAEAAAARATVAAFIAAEARAEASADTLVSPGAEFIATGVLVARRPRLAGMPGRGEGTVIEVRTELAGGVAWVVAVYRWTGRTADQVERARATFVLERRAAGWRIRHVHSSWVEPWE